jgi:radical SAM superfamily enzyme YgiQ (UPF0313 family)
MLTSYDAFVDNRSQADLRNRFQYVFPLGLSCISAALKKAGHPVDCLDLNHREGDVSELIQAYLNERAPYDFVLSGGRLK